MGRQPLVQRIVIVGFVSDETLRLVRSGAALHQVFDQRHLRLSQSPLRVCEVPS